MDFKKLFRKDDKAVSPVIGVILMVAITVILAAAIGSSVFGQGTAKPAPKANLNFQAAGIDNTGGLVKIEHLGGDPINFAETSTSVTAYFNGSTNPEKTNATTIGVMDVGSVKTLSVTGVNKGAVVELKFVDLTSKQLLFDKVLRY